MLKNYISHKKVKAEKMNRKEAEKNGLVRDIKPNIEDEEGYRVVYSNDYESWSPKNNFDNGYISEDEVENISDGYHSFKELYRYRKLYNAGFFNELGKQNLYNVHKAKKHSDGKECFGGGYFIVVAELPTGQISNHYEMKDWDLFNTRIFDEAIEFDGHTPEDVATRIEDFLKMIK